MFEWAPGILVFDNMIGYEDEGYSEWNPKDELVEEIVEDIDEEEDMY